MYCVAQSVILSGVRVWGCGLSMVSDVRFDSEICLGPVITIMVDVAFRKDDTSVVVAAYVV